jgi:hypothetical protein
MDEKIIEEIMASEPMERVLAIETTAMVTGRAGQYHGKTITEVLKEALHRVRQDEREKVLNIFCKDEQSKEVVRNLLTPSL